MLLLGKDSIMISELRDIIISVVVIIIVTIVDVTHFTGYNRSKSLVFCCK
jgi:hypothetical protein